jgi:hypothetical protein
MLSERGENLVTKLSNLSSYMTQHILYSPKAHNLSALKIRIMLAISRGSEFQSFGVPHKDQQNFSLGE